MPDAEKKTSCWVCHGKGYGGWNGDGERCDSCGGSGMVADIPYNWDPMGRRYREWDQARREENQRTRDARG